MTQTTTEAVEDALSISTTESLVPSQGSHRDDSARRYIEQLLAQADVRIDGTRPWDIRLHDPGVPARVLALGSLGLGEAYMDGHWDCAHLDQLFDRLLRARLDRTVRGMSAVLHHLRARLFNRQTVRRAWQVGHTHYDLGNDFYAAMLDTRMTYTCGFWEGCGTLDEAQAHKLDLVCRKLGLQPGMRVLDIGCGWGSFMRFAAKRYGVQCTGVTISAEQAGFVRAQCAGLPIETRLADYRDLDGRFDRIVSLGMFEHVGRKNHAAYMRVAERCLADDGLFLLHTIGRNESGHGTDPWIDRYIFPNGELPTLADIGLACEDRFVVEDLHNFGADYDRTLMAWHANFEAAWPAFSRTLGPRFHRMWRYYLLSCAGAFRARDLQLWQWVLSKPGRSGVYRRVSTTR
ncbi:cyclopropane fatty acyl phospholipid synthase [Ralstonia pseudosolanacearum]|uniref:cyclopropane fatty acyl phospholipid synthase n=1 Tax=Ralstonia pseudosolanacearum TaxID=1310165 RepID=UPI0018A362D3|nr:cyclopropane fatty acyl phospholipid synthase [Ralstonia pseudosolanacearum]BCL94031.1 cyclopropane-fatty-acyl-phospholipid synthase [Ralstonia solanacearum]BCM00442.1 cyclopropane-fatty-acyl-phospholipid synthase [Ralstonia solanacearum]BCM14655.1 cyclopropane-fatty-acyl-phospholipid synthase [Ralstonia solanacearum]BCN06597.1 cyclopropane-fatty-acyl-phospholipid synthase [Ralstonia solanacearum]